MRRPAWFSGLACLILSLWPGAAHPSCICLKCALPQFEMFQIPASSMAPLLSPGDCPTARLVDPQRWAPQRGDVIVFRDGATGDSYISRVIGWPGDSIEHRDGTVLLNGRALSRSRLADYRLDIAPPALHPVCPTPPAPGATHCTIPQFRETLPSGRSYLVLDLGPRPLDTLPRTIVPPSHLYVLGDHRDNAIDSRLPPERGGRGFVPMLDVLGVFEALGPDRRAD